MGELNMGYKMVAPKGTIMLKSVTFIEEIT